MTWFKRKQPSPIETLTIGQIDVEVPSRFLPTVHQAIAASKRCDTEPSVATLNAAIAAWQNVTKLSGLSEHSLLFIVARAELAMALCARLYTQAVAGDLETALHLIQELLRVEHPALTAERPRWLNALSIAYRKRFEDQRDIHDLSTSIAIAFEAVRSATPQSPYWERIQNNLGLGLLLRYHITGQASDLDAAISAFRTALTVCDPTSRQWGMRQVNLAGALLLRFQRSGQQADIAAALEALDSAQNVIRPGSPNWFELQGQRSMALLYRFDAFGDTRDLDEALAAVTDALRWTPAASPKREALEINRGVILETRFTAQGAVADLDAAIAVYRDVIRELPPENLYWTRAQIDLGGALIRRFVLLKNPSDIDDAIAAFNKALQRVEPNGPEWATIQNNMGTALSERYKARQQLDDLNASIAAYRAAIGATPPNTWDWATRQSNLGSALHERFQRWKRATDLDKASDVQTRVVSNLNEASNAQARAVSDLNEAIDAHGKAVSATQEDTYAWAAYHLQFSAALQSRYELFSRPEDAEAIFAACQKAYNFFRAGRWPEHALLATQNLAAVYTMRKAWAQASEILLEGVQLINSLYRRQLLDQDREGWLARAAHIYRRAAYALARAGRLQEAVVVLEQGRARGLADALHRDQASLEHVRTADPEAYALYTRAAERFRELQRRERQERLESAGVGTAQGQPTTAGKQPALRAEMAEAQAAMDTALARIRRLPGFESYLVEPTFTDIARAVEPAAPLVYLDMVTDSAFALIVSRASMTEVPTVVPLWLDRVTGAALKDLMLKREELGIEGSYLRGLINEQFTDLLALDPALDEMLPYLGEHLIGPLASHLRAHGDRALVLLPGFFLPLLPLHAASYQVHGRKVYFQDEFTVRYAPSARVLAFTRQRQRAATTALLAVGDPRGRPQHPDKPQPAYFADWLAREAARLLDGPSPLVREAATTRAVERSLQASRPAHVLLGCHGFFDPTQPLRSHMRLADGDLTLAWLLDHVDLSGTTLVTLCSCQTGLREFSRVPDEALGFPAGFLEVGAQAVIAPLWSVDVLPTVLLLRHLYRQISLGTVPSEALRQSVIWLRTMSRSTFEAEVAELRGGLDDVESKWKLDEITRVYRGPQPFAAPRYWAAFAFHGISLS